jgi:uncharacterized membrane protein HdeD (DUF308 family)
MHIMHNTEYREVFMDEKVYKTITLSGVCSLVIGIITLVFGVASGVLLIVSGGQLLKSKNNHLI